MNNKQSEIKVTALAQTDRADWEVLYRGYAVFYKVPMDDRILDTVWDWIHDTDNPFFGLIARDAAGYALGLMHCRQMPSPLRGALVGFLDDLFVPPDVPGLASRRRPTGYGPVTQVWLNWFFLRAGALARPTSSLHNLTR